VIVRELVTRMGFRINEGQLASLENGIKKVKRTAQDAADSMAKVILPPSMRTPRQPPPRDPFIAPAAPAPRPAPSMRTPLPLNPAAQPRQAPARPPTAPRPLPQTAPAPSPSPTLAVPRQLPSIAPPKIDGVSQNLDRVKSKIGEVKNEAEKAAASLRNMVLALASLATLRSFGTIADEMQSMRTRIGMLPQTVGDAGAAFDEVANRASAAGQSIMAYGNLYNRLGNAAKDYIGTQEELLGVTDTISKALVVGGATAQEQASAMLQFSQALGSGVFQGDEFKAMAEAAPQFLDKLSEMMKIPREELKKMASEGKLTTKPVIEAVQKMGDYFAEKFKQMPMNFGRAATIIGNRFSRLIDKMNRDSMFVTNIANAFLWVFDKIEAGIYAVGDAFDGWDNALRLIGITLGVALGAKALAILSAFNAATLVAMLPFIKMAAIIGAVALVIEDLYIWINGGNSLVGSLIGPWEKWRPYVTAAVEKVKQVFSFFVNLLLAYSKLFKGLFLLDWALFKQGLDEAGRLLWSALSMYANFIWEGITTVFNAVADFIGGLFVKLGKYLYQLIIVPIIEAYNTVKATVLGIVQTIGEALKTVGSIVASIFTDLGRTIYDSIFKPIISAVTDAWASVKNFASGALQGAASVFGLSSGPTAAPQALGNTVTPSQLAPAAMGATRPNVQSNTNVNVTVPPGTTAEQTRFIESAAQRSFGKATDDRLARDLAVYAP